jgi:hypothetical protein
MAADHTLLADIQQVEIKTVDSDDSSAPQSVRVLRRFVALSPRVKYGLLHGNQ